jgi:type IV pilus assembly protein PilC
MPEFIARVGTPAGDIREETHVASDEQALRAELNQRDLHVFEVRSRGVGVSLGGLRVGGSAKRVPRRQFLLFNQELVTLIKAGLPLLQCLDVLLERMPEGPLQRYLSDVRDRVRSGSSLSEAFAAQGEAFPRIYSASLAAGERSGEMAAVVSRYVSFVRKTEQMRSKVTSALIYPTLLTFMSVALICLLLFYILPKFSTFFIEFDKDLPLLTDIVMRFALWLQGNGLIILGLVVIGTVAARVWYTTPPGRLFFHGLALRIPLAGVVLQKYNIAQFCRTMSTMLSGGIPLVPALQTTAGAVGNEVYVGAIRRATNEVSEGRPLWESLDDTGAMTDLAIEMIKVGEATGALAQMQSDVADFYDEQVDESMTRVVALFEPVLLVTMGCIIAVLLLAMYLPIFQLAGGA